MCDRLLAEGWEVLCLDSMLTGESSNLDVARSNERFRFEHVDVSEGFSVAGDVDWVLHMASPASPRDYQDNAVATLKVGSLGTLNCLELAREKRAGVLLTSTSEVYGDPLVHPQTENYWGNVNPIGPRSMYDESKRFAEALTVAYHRTHATPVRIVRIFNTYGPRIRAGDGRVVPAFLSQALRGEPMTVHGDGGQTRSLCYVDDLVEGIWRMLTRGVMGPVNLGNPEEVTMLELARLVRDVVGSDSEIVFTDRPADDPQVRRPDISRARDELGWQPIVPMTEGLARTAASFREILVP
jgi:dTDP-glucose 4,6-dehydratase